MLLPVYNVTHVCLAVDPRERTYTRGLIVPPLSLVDVAVGEMHGARSMPLVVAPVACVNSKSIGIPDLAKSISFIVSEVSNVTASVGVLHDTTTMASTGGMAFANIGVFFLVRLRLLFLELRGRYPRLLRGRYRGIMRNVA